MNQIDYTRLARDVSKTADEYTKWTPTPEDVKRHQARQRFLYDIQQKVPPNTSEPQEQNVVVQEIAVPIFEKEKQTTPKASPQDLALCSFAPLTISRTEVISEGAMLPTSSKRVIEKIRSSGCPSLSQIVQAKEKQNQAEDEYNWRKEIMKADEAEKQEQAQAARLKIEREEHLARLGLDVEENAQFWTLMAELRDCLHIIAN